MKLPTVKLIINGYKSLIVMAIISLTLASMSDVTGQPASKPRGPNGLYPRAPDTIPGTLPEMRDPSYWISKLENPEKVIMTTAQIQARNSEFFKRMNNFSTLDSNLRKQITQELASRPGLISSKPNLNSMSGEDISSLTTDMVDKEIKFLTRRRFGNILGNEYSPAEIKSVQDEMAFTAIPKQIKVQTGISVSDTRLRIVPETRFDFVGYNGLAGWDMWNFDIVPIGSHIEILHASKSGGSLFVLTEKGLGWINSQDVALCSVEELNKYLNDKNFVICTGDRIPYYSDANCRFASGWFRMGDRLPVKNNNARLVQVPTRMMNGNLLIQEAWLATDADVSKGYLPYTRKNIVNQVFKLQDNLYDWTGGFFGRDHATQLRDIFAVFGFKLPQMGGMISAYNANPKFIYPKEGKEAQYKAILANDPFTTIQTCSSGHSQLYLGNYKGEPIVFDTHGYRFNDKNGTELTIRRANVGNMAFPDYFLKQYFSFVELK